jgi:hypothetical protein
MAAEICFAVVVFEPNTTVPPMMAASAASSGKGSISTAPIMAAAIQIAPVAIATFDARLILRHRARASLRSSIRPSRRAISWGGSGSAESSSGVGPASSCKGSRIAAGFSACIGTAAGFPAVVRRTMGRRGLRIQRQI